MLIICRLVLFWFSGGFYWVFLVLFGIGVLEFCIVVCFSGFFMGVCD